MKVDIASGYTNIGKFERYSGGTGEPVVAVPGGAVTGVVILDGRLFASSQAGIFMLVGKKWQRIELPRAEY